MQTPAVLASTLAVTASALLFSLAHHAGTPGEAFTWFAFIFRWLAGVYFAWVFVVRGFGVAVGTHTAYDILVGAVGWHFESRRPSRNGRAESVRIIHLSDIHVWRYAFNPLQLFNKRVVGMAELVSGRARKFRLERLRAVVDRVLRLGPTTS